MQSSLLESAPAVLSKRETIAKGSKSFYLASLFFTPEQRDASWNLYRWCRSCDDRIDHAPSKDHALIRLSELRLCTEQAAGSRLAFTPEFIGLREICTEYYIPKQYPLDLIEGMAMDVSDFKYETIEQVELYSYRVAGVVGLMMCHAMRVFNTDAHPHAIAMGTAMQLTNISRDVREDSAIGRVYLPAVWLREAGVSPVDLFHDKRALYSVVVRLLDRADVLYKEGYAGLRYLPFRAALAVSIAGSIYSAIGKKIRRKGPSALDRRTVVSLPHKLLCVLTGTIRALRRRRR